MAFDSKKTILLEKKYLYVRASLGFQLEGVSTEKIPTNNGFYRFYVDNLSKALGNSYVNILYDSQDLTLQCFCSDLYMDELMSSDSSAIEDVVEELKKNTTTIIEFENGVSSAFKSNHQDNVALSAVVEGVGNTNHKDISEFSQNSSKYLSKLLWSNSVYNNSLYYITNNGNAFINIDMSFTDFVPSWRVEFDNNKRLMFFCHKHFPLCNTDWANFSFNLDVPKYFDSITETLSSSSYHFLVGGFLISCADFKSFNNDICVNTGKRYLTLSNFFNYHRMASSIIGNGSSYFTMCSEISENLYKFLCLCSRSLENSVYVSSNNDSIVLLRDKNMPCCTLNQKLSISKNFGSVTDYSISFVFDFPFDENIFKKFHFYFFVNNSYVEVVPLNVSKISDSSLSCDFKFTGSSFYNILSMSVFPSV